MKFTYHFLKPAKSFQQYSEEGVIYSTSFVKQAQRKCQPNKYQN